MTNATILIAYFSHSGNTETVARQIQDCVGGDLFRIVTVEPYPVDYNAVVEVARKEQKSGHRPKLAESVARMASYEVVFVGYPNWWSTMPMAVFSFLEEYDLSGKRIAPFCTHEGSGLGRSLRDLREVCPRSEALSGLAVRGGRVSAAMKDVRAWLGRIGMAGSRTTDAS